MIWLAVTYRANISAALEIMLPLVFLAHQNSAYPIILQVSCFTQTTCSKAPEFTIPALNHIQRG